MNKKLKIIIAGLLVNVASMNAIATEVGSTYFTAGVMKISTDELDVLAASGVTIDDEDTAVTFGVGYQFDENLSFEAGVIGESEASATLSGSESGTINGKSYSISGALTIKAQTDTSYTLGMRYSSLVNENLDVYGKAGLLFWDLKGLVSADGTLTYDGSTYTASGTAQFYQNDGNDPYFGMGGSYKLNQTTSLDLDYIKMEVDDGDVDGLSLAVNVDF